MAAARHTRGTGACGRVGRSAVTEGCGQPRVELLMQCGADRGCAVQSRRADAPRCCCCLLLYRRCRLARGLTLLARAWHCRPELDNTGPSLRTADPSLTLLARSCHYWPEVDICDPPELHVTTIQSRHDSTACTTTVYWPELAH